MTAPTGPDTGDDAATTVQALKDQAGRLGLIWELRTATVTSASDPAAVMVTIDGDTIPIPAVSLTGLPAVGARVAVVSIPPAGQYIIGGLGGTTARQLTNRADSVASANLTLGAADASVVGTLITLSTVGEAEWEATAFADIRETGAGTTIAVVSLYVDGVAQTAQILFAMSAIGDRATVGQQWSGTFTSGGTHTFELQGSRTVALGTQLVDAIHTTLTVKTFE